MLASPGKILLGALLLGTLVPVVTPAGAGADVRLSRDRTAANVAAYGDVVAWSRETAARRRWKLVERVGGRTFDAPARPSSLPFDVDMGPSLIGSPVAVYTRCTIEDCDLYEFDFTMAREFKVRGASSPHCYEGAASTWQGTIAFARSPHFEGTGRGCRSGFYLKRGAGEPVRIGTRVPVATDLSGEHVAAAYFYGTHAGSRTSIELRDARGANHRTVARGAIDRRGRGTAVSEPALDGGVLYHLSDEAAYHQRVIGRPVAPGAPGIVTRAMPIETFAVNRGTIYYTRRGVFRLER